MPTTVVLDSEVCRYLSSFSIAAVAVHGGRIVAYHRPGDIPGCVDWIGWCRSADAERVVRRATHFGKLTDAANAVAAAARDVGVGLTAHDDLLRRVQAATQRIANDVETARMAGRLKDFNREFKNRRLKAQSEGRPFMSYETAKRRLRGALATKAARRSGVVANTNTTDLLASVFGDA
jgi:hypothetical protein